MRHAPSVNGTVDGSLQQLIGESLTLNGGANVTGNLRVPGTPLIRINGNPSFIGTTDMAGSSSPSNYQITLNGNSSLRNVVRRIDPLALVLVSAPPLPVATSSVVVNIQGQAVGSWSGVRNLILNGGVGNYNVPPGTYGDFTANGGTVLTLGTEGQTQPTVYNFQHVTLNGQAQIRLLGPVVINLAYGFNGNGTIGSSAKPSWLTLNIY